MLQFFDLANFATLESIFFLLIFFLVLKFIFKLRKSRKKKYYRPKKHKPKGIGKTKEFSLPSIETKYGLLHCDGTKCSLNDTCSEAERLFCRDVIKPCLGDTLINSQFIVCLPSGIRKIDFAFSLNGKRKVAVELDGFVPHIEDLKRITFDEQLKRQNELVLEGWEVLRFSFDQLVYGTQYCINSLQYLINGQPPGNVTKFDTSFVDVFYPYSENSTAIPLLKESGILFSEMRKRWYYPAHFEPYVQFPEHWTLTQWQNCAHCQQKAFINRGQNNFYGRCSVCNKTFSLNRRHYASR